MPSTAHRRSRFTGLPADVWALGVGSLLMDTSSELVHSLLPVLMTTVLGAPMATVGLVEGIAEATAAVTKIFSGALSDYLGRRKWLVVFGYGLAAASKPVFPVAGSVSWVLAARFMDRIGKGIRGAPRDALVADVTPPTLRGAAFGLRQSLDSVGAVLGPGLALLCMWAFDNNIGTSLWVAVVPALLTVVVLAAVVREPSAPVEQLDAHAGVSGNRATWRDLPLRFWLVVALAAVFTLARFSEAFLILRAQDVGLPLGRVPLVLVVMNLVYAASAYPAGRAADRMSARTLMLCGLLLLVLADIALAVAGSPMIVFVAVAFWGLHLGLTQGMLSKLVADAAPASLRGSAFGIFNFVTGVGLLVASSLAGALWSARGAAATFWAGATFAGLTALGLVAYHRPRRG